jgi:hypothetical protein
VAAEGRGVVLGPSGKKSPAGENAAAQIGPDQLDQRVEGRVVSACHRQHELLGVPDVERRWA